MKIWVYTISHNEGYMMPFFLRHYSKFADKIIVFDEASTDGTREAVRACKRAELRDWPGVGLDDDAFREAQSTWYHEAEGRADWVMWPDVDELLWHPNWRIALFNAQGQGINLIQSEGFNLTPDEPPKDDGKSQFYDLCKVGILSLNYTKMITFRPQLKLWFDYGRHNIVSAQGVRRASAGKLFHCHFLGLKYMAARNQRNYDRAREKRFAWNYAPEHNLRDQPGTPEWFKWIKASGQIRNVVDASPA